MDYVQIEVAMKFERFYIPSTMQPYEVKEDTWIMQPSLEQFGIKVKGVGTSLATKDAMIKIKDWCNARNVYIINNLIFFDTEAQRFEFEMAWL